MATDAQQYALVLVGRYAGRDKAVAQALAQVFGRDEAWALPVVGASPINLLVHLSFSQAESIRAALSDVEKAGCRLEVQSGLDPSCPTLSWASDPLVHGKPINEFGAAGQAPAGPAAIQQAAVVCPHCGRTIYIGLAAEAASPAGEPIPIPVPKGAPAQATVPREPRPPVQIPVPPLPGVRSASRKADAGGPQAAPAPGPAEFGEPLPRPVGSSPYAADPHLQTPVDLESVAVGSGEPARAPRRAAGSARGKTAAAAKNGPPEAARPPGRPTDPAAPCSVFIGRTSNPEVLALFAEVAGLQLRDAERLCQRPVVSVARDIPLAQAEQIKARFLALNVQPRIIFKP
jgi:hypothetical protein